LGAFPGQRVMEKSSLVVWDELVLLSVQDQERRNRRPYVGDRVGFGDPLRAFPDGGAQESRLRERARHR